MGTWLDPVAGALDAAPAPVPFFCRDDDAGWGDGRLIELLDAFSARGVWVDVAVIPCALDVDLARELTARDGLGLHQHGLAHVNHEREGRRSEFGAARPAARQRADIDAGRARLEMLLGRRLDPIFTPPWNRCTAATGSCLGELGFRVLSREARAEPLRIDGLLELPVCVDWTRRGPDGSARAIAEAIPAGRPVGVMFHHAEMEAGELRLAGELLGLLAGHEHCDARPMMAIDAALARSRPPG